MGLEDISLFRSLPNSAVFYPSDAVSTEKLVQLAYKTPGIKYIRTTRPKTPVLYDNNESFPLSDFKVLRQSKSDKVVLIGSGITLHESIKAHELLKKKKINQRPTTKKLKTNFKRI
jgi:transketolase